MTAPPPPKPLPPPRSSAAAPGSGFGDRLNNLQPEGIPRALEFALFLVAMVWALAATAIASRAAQGITLRFNLLAAEPLLEALFLLFLAVLGFRALDWVATRGVHSEQVLALPRRSTRTAEWASGAALGWALALATALPILLTLNLHSHLSWHLAPVLLALPTLLAGALAEEVIFRGYPFERLARALGQTVATLLLSLLFAVFLFSATSGSHGLLALAGEVLFGVLLSMAWLRTHALWTGWGLHFAYRFITAVLLGLPIAGRADFGSIAETYTTGPRWLTGGNFGPDAALLTLPVLLLGMAVLYRITRNWAWAYTHAPIVAGGYEVEIPPPAAHTAMERTAAPPPLVQILPTTPQTRNVEAPTHVEHSQP